MYELIDGLGKMLVGLSGYEKFWRIQYLLAIDLGIIEKGEAWKGPITTSSSVCVNGPIYLPLSNSLCMISRNGAAYLTIEGRLGGVWVVEMGGKSILNPVRRPSMICACLSLSPAAMRFLLW